MLKVIPTQSLKLGMFVNEIQGSWIDNPFWRKSFLLENRDDLNKLLASNVNAIQIDTDKGLDLDLAELRDDAVLSPPIEMPTPTPKIEFQRVSASVERAHANKLIKASKQAVTNMFAEARMGKAINTTDALPLVNSIVDSVSRNEGAITSLVRLKSKDDYTYLHSVAVCALMIALAKELGLNEVQVKQAGVAGLFHDIGKMAVSSEVLNKPGALSDEEFGLVKMHPEKGYAILKASKDIDEVCLDVCLHHHEKVDGSGYPHQLKDNQISLFAKMGAVCDVYDAITSNRPYKAGWEPGVSLQRMAQWTTHFDQVVFKAFVKCVGIYPIGSLVKLQSGKLAVVIDQSAGSLLTPIVKVFFSTKSKTRIPHEIVDLSKAGAKDKVTGHEDPSDWGIKDLNTMW
jgi:putative nucleotidyltransferase with HDIG domain